MILNELFTTSGHVEWVRNSKRHTGQFTVDNIPFTIVFSKEEPQRSDDDDFESVPLETWECMFGVDQGYAREHGVRVCGNTGHSGTSAVRVMSIVVNEIEQFLKDVSPDVMEFSGCLNNGKGQLYKKMVNAMAKRTAALRYRVEVEDMGTELVFRVIGA